MIRNRWIREDGFKSHSEIANALNDFYLCFNDEFDFTIVHNNLFDILSDCTATSQFTISVHSIRSMFHKCNTTKSPGPDMITSKFLKVCADQLCDIFMDLF